MLGFRGRAVFVALLFAAFAPFQAQAGNAVVYEVRLAGSSIGTFTIQQQQEDGERRVASTTELKVMLGPVPLHSYKQETEEVWRADELVAFTSDTTENGSNYRVEGRRTGSGFLVEGNAGQSLVNEAIGTLSGLVLGISRDAVIDAETGAIREISLSRAEFDRTEVEGQSFDSLRQEVRGGVKADTWSDGKGVLRMIIKSKLATVEFLRQDIVQQAALPEALPRVVSER